MRISKIRRNINNFFDELFAYIYYVFCPEKKKVKIILFAQGRTGSTLLEDLLDSTGKLKKHGELYAGKYSVLDWRRLFPIAYILGKSKRGKQNFIFHCKIYNLTDRQKVDPQTLLQNLTNKGWKILYLHRDNKLKHVLSTFTREHRGKPFKRDTDKSEFHYSVDINRFENSMFRRHEQTIAEKKILDELDYIDVSYERDLENPEMHRSTVFRILEELNLSEEAQLPVTGYKRINDRPIKDFVDNYDELYESLKRNGCLHYLDER